MGYQNLTLWGHKFLLLCSEWGINLIFDHMEGGFLYFGMVFYFIIEPINSFKCHRLG